MGISLLAPLSSRHLLPRFLPSSCCTFATRKVSPSLSAIYFHLFFAAIGATTGEALVSSSFVSNCLSTFGFVSVALGVHILTLLSFVGWRRLTRRSDEEGRRTMRELMMASNA